MNIVSFSIFLIFNNQVNSDLYIFIIFFFSVNTLMLGKPERGKIIEDMLIRMAQKGQIITKINEKDLIGLLETINEQSQNKSVVKFDRRRVTFDSDEEDL